MPLVPVVKNFGLPGNHCSMLHDVIWMVDVIIRLGPAPAAEELAEGPLPPPVEVRS